MLVTSSMGASTFSLAVHDHASIAVNRLPAHLTRVSARQEDDAGCDLARLAWPAHGAGELLLRLLVHRGVNQRRPDGTWCYGVDADALADELVCKASREAYDGTFCACVVEKIWPADVGVD